MGIDQEIDFDKNDWEEINADDLSQIDEVRVSLNS